MKWVCDKKNRLSCKARVAVDADKNIKVINSKHNHRRNHYEIPPEFISIEEGLLEQAFEDVDEVKKGKGIIQIIDKKSSKNVPKMKKYK